MIKTAAHKTAILGDLIAAAFDRAATVTSDPDVAARLASFTVAQWLTRTQRFDLLRLLGGELERATPRRREDAPQRLAA